MGIEIMIARHIERAPESSRETCVVPCRDRTSNSQWQGPTIHPPKDNARKRGLRRLLARMAMRAAGKRGSTPRFSHQAQQIMIPLLATNGATALRVAATLGISRQTLHRRLDAEGTNFKKLLAATRQQLAIRYLRVEKVPVKVAAWRLGFSSPAAFSRAFKRWTGVSPGRFQSALT